MLKQLSTKLLHTFSLVAVLYCPVIADELDNKVVDFWSNRKEIAKQLAEQVSTCILRKDTDHPAFHGCIDWHSAVHGVWALIAYTRITGDYSYVPIIKNTLNINLLDSEHSSINSKPMFEMPYGRAWFLRLALDYKQTFNSDLLDKFADDIAASLMNYYTQHPPTPMSREYNNSSWALLNLYDYAISRNNQRTIQFIKNCIKNFYMTPIGNECPILKQEIKWADFMAVCTNWAMLVSRILDNESFTKWVDYFLPENAHILPIAHPRNSHHYGLNFSRAWGYWALYKKTNEARFYRDYIQHFKANYTNKEWWSGDYYKVGHWVAQFGMFAIAGTFDNQ